MYSGSKTGAGVGFMSGAFKIITNPEGFCFVAGTVVMTAVGLVAIEDLQPGDVVYSMVAADEEQQVDLSQELDRKVILETYAHEVDETYVVTIDGESIEATPEHPFYNVDGEEVQAKDLKEGDKLATADGDTATVDSVECIHHDEPVMVYNIAVCDSHTYFVGENNVLVHNMCGPIETSHGESSANLEKAKGWKVGDPIDNLTKAGNEPSWSTVRARYWKNEAYYNADDYLDSDLIRMRKGLAPIEPETGASMELHHINGRDIPNPHNIDNLQKVWPWEHDAIDIFRHYVGPRPKGE